MTGSSTTLQNGPWGRKDGTQEKNELGMVALLRVDTRRNGRPVRGQRNGLICVGNRFEQQLGRAILPEKPQGAGPKRQQQQRARDHRRGLRNCSEQEGRVQIFGWHIIIYARQSVSFLWQGGHRDRASRETKNKR